jgi:hypothetical protein
MLNPFLLTHDCLFVRLSYTQHGGSTDGGRTENGGRDNGRREHGRLEIGWREHGAREPREAGASSAWQGASNTLAMRERSCSQRRADWRLMLYSTGLIRSDVRQIVLLGCTVVICGPLAILNLSEDGTQVALNVDRDHRSGVFSADCVSLAPEMAVVFVARISSTLSSYSNRAPGMHRTTYTEYEADFPVHATEAVQNKDRRASPEFSLA